MNLHSSPAPAWAFRIGLLLATLNCVAPVRAVTTVFFDASQSTNLVVAGTTWDTLSSEGYEFNLTRDEWFTGGVGMTNPIGRYLRIHWPEGLEAQALTAGPTPGGAKIEIRRTDRQPFAIATFSAVLLANTAGAGGAFEIMPQLNGDDAIPDPYAYNASGFSGSRFTYVTPELSGYDAYKITLYVDFALTALTAVDASPPPPTLEVVKTTAQALELSWPADAAGYLPESAGDLGVGGWIPVASPISIVGDRAVVRLEATAAVQFFRLRR